MHNERVTNRLMLTTLSSGKKTKRKNQTLHEGALNRRAGSHGRDNPNPGKTEKEKVRQVTWAVAPHYLIRVRDISGRGPGCGGIKLFRVDDGGGGLFECHQEFMVVNFLM